MSTVTLAGSVAITARAVVTGDVERYRSTGGMPERTLGLPFTKKSLSPYPVHNVVGRG